MKRMGIHKSALRRSTILGVGMFAVFGALLLRILLIQTVDFEKYQSKVLNQMTTESAVTADRGKIYDVNGNVLATNITTYRVFISPSGIESAQNELGDGANRHYAEEIANGLSALLGVSYEDVYKQAVHYTEYLDRTIKPKVDEAKADEVRRFIDDYGLHDMVYLEAQSTRYYPGGALGAHMIGFTGADGNGLYGLEYQYDKYLKGVNGYYINARDSYGNEMPYEYTSYIEPVDGYHLNTTIDTTIQSFLQEQVEKAAADSAAQNRACGIVMNVKTGAILGMATSSSFDLNNPSQLDALSLGILNTSEYAAGTEEYATLNRELLMKMWSNKAITESYIPGSTFKIITSSMALEDQRVQLLETVNCGGSKQVLGRTIHCHKRQGHGLLTFTQGLQQSCNVWFMTAGLRVGEEQFLQYVKSFGYRENTGIDLPGEGNSIIASEISELDLAIYAFGQNFNVTPIQQLTAISAVANGGKLMTPYIVSSVTDHAGNVVYSREPEVRRTVISQEVSETLSRVLEEGVSTDGGAKNAYVDGYTVAAKTGTSEKKERECPRCGNAGAWKETVNETVYYACTVCQFKGTIDQFAVSEKYICSCVAYAPAEDPEIAIVIIVDEPTEGVLYGSTVAAPYIADALENILPYYGVATTNTEKKTVTLANYRNWTVNAAKNSLEQRGIQYQVVGTGDKVLSQLPAGGSKLDATDGVVYLYTTKEMPATVKVPNLVGKTAVAANQILLNSGLNVKIDGATNNMVGTNGATVIAQSIEADTMVAKGTVITITFRYLDGDEDADYMN